MPSHSLLAGVLVTLGLLSSAQCSSWDPWGTPTATVTNVHITCPCDGSKTTTLLGLGTTWSDWSATLTNIDDWTTPGSYPTNSWPANDLPFPTTWNLSPTSLCYTTMHPTPYPFATTASAWFTSTSCTVTSTSTTTTVITPTAPTTTTTSTVSVTTTITASATTDTATDTATDTSTTTVTSTETDTETDTVTATTTTTSTVAAPATFTPVDLSDPGVTNQQVPISKKVKRDPVTRGSHRIGLMSPQSLFPGDVLCNHFISQCSTATATTTATSTASTPSTITVNTTTTTTISTTITPGVTTTTTVTISTTTTDSTTVTTTTTTNTTSTTTASATYYAACDQTTNGGQYYDNNGITGGDYQGTDNVVTNDAGSASAYDCCVAALLDPVGALYAYALQGANSPCIVIEAPNCDNGQGSTTSNTIVYTVGASPAYVVGNANCGVWDSALT